LIFLGVAYIFFGSSSRLKVLCAFALANFIITYYIYPNTDARDAAWDAALFLVGDTCAFGFKAIL
jgi:hypothetical protein